jgi:excisionase family DNA binding protein
VSFKGKNPIIGQSEYKSVWDFQTKYQKARKGGENMLTTTEMAKRLGVSSATVAGWCRNGKIKATKINGRWHIPEEEFKSFPTALSKSSPDISSVIAILGGRRGLYRWGRIFGDVNSLLRGPSAVGRRLLRKSVWKAVGKSLRKLLS